VQYSISPLHHLREHREPVDAIAWSPDGNTLITGADKSLYMWDPKVRTGTHFCLQRVDELTVLQTGLQKSTQFGETQHTDTISGIQWSPDGSTFAVASMDYKLIFYVSGPSVGSGADVYRMGNDH
jgi:WD40 repeat protein